MNQEEHVKMARELLGRADQESRDGGNEIIAADGATTGKCVFLFD